MKSKLLLIYVVLIYLVTNSYAQSDTKVQCGNDLIPAGWVIIKIESCFGCCNSIGKSTLFTIRNLNNEVSGSSADILSGSKIPNGWVVTNIYKEGSNTIYRIQKIEGIVSDTELDVCTTSNIPQGWVIINYKLCNCCGGINNTQWRIRNINNLPIGSQVEMCENNNIPNGWIKISLDPNCSCCGAKPGTFGRKVWIKKI